MPTRVANRYQVQEQIGRGGMGIVFRAHDRLLDRVVALKQVTVDDAQLQYRRAENIDDLRLQLTQEFRTLATLRHPNIISVLDYGFDVEGYPFFTMDYLADAQPITRAATARPLEQRVTLLLSLLEALTYLHRRGVVHRDLKPANVLVDADDQVRVLDFGLALAPDEQMDSFPAGTISYMAPEMLNLQPSSVASDLFAVGIIAYEMLTGNHPFASDTLPRLIHAIRTEPVELSPLDSDLAPVVGRLLQKEPADRYATAADTTHDIARRLKRPLPVEDTAVRESYLQASRFVGRENEFGQLRNALQGTINGQGSIWLVSGESGVGKSRLLDELRIHALVEGALVLNGQAIDGGGRPYELWRVPAQRLALAVDMTIEQAQVLKELAPDIDRLIGQSIEAAPRLDGEAGQGRLIATLTSLITQSEQPVVLMMEDLQWTTESLEVLRAVSRLTDDHPLLVIGTYRSDEAHELVGLFPGANHLRLERLEPDAVADLAGAMLGQAGQDDALVAYLTNQTEGNTLFIVEVMRALAEEAGGLDRVSEATLPDQIFSAGMDAILRRRLDRVPPADHPLLKLAAVAGRRLDLSLLGLAAPQMETEAWLGRCHNAAVLDLAEGQWRFAHDKLRERVMVDLTDDECVALHRQVAEAIQAVYPEDSDRAGALTEHWYAAGDAGKTFHFARIAARRALQAPNYHGALHFVALALESAAGGESTADLHVIAGRAHAALSETSDSLAAFEQALKLADSAEDPAATRIDALVGQGDVHVALGDFDAARATYAEARELAQETQNNAGIARAYLGDGLLASESGRYEEASLLVGQALEYAHQTDEAELIGTALWRRAINEEKGGDYQTADRSYREALSKFEEVGARSLAAEIYNSWGVWASKQHRLEIARERMEQAVKAFRATGQPARLAVATLNLAINTKKEGQQKAEAGDSKGARADYLTALRHYEDCLRTFELIEHKMGVMASLNNIASVTEILDMDDRSRQAALGSLRLAHEADNVRFQLYDVMALAKLEPKAGNPVRGVELLSCVLANDQGDDDLRQQVTESLDVIQEALSGDEYRAALEHGRALDFAAAVADLLAS